MFSINDSRIPDNIRPRIQEGENGCWLWSGPLNHSDYGCGCHGGKNWAIHRLIWTKLVGEIGFGLQLDHTCKVKHCCNPEHLKEVTPGQHSATRRAPKNHSSYAVTFGYVEQLCDGLREIHKKYGLHISVLSRILPLENGCWKWVGHLNPQGYGRMTLFGQNRAAHIAVRELCLGEHDSALHLHHECGNQWCVNPEHLTPLTPSQHAKVSPSALYQLSKTHCPNGHLYDESNTYRNNSSKSKTRRCKACTQITNQKQYAKRMALKL